MSSALRRYANLNARIRARLARLPGRRHLETLAAYPDESSLRRELAAFGATAELDAVLATFDVVLGLLDGTARDVVESYRARYECENLKLLLRAVELRTPYDELRPLLYAVGDLGPGDKAQELLGASTLVDAVSLLPPVPFGLLLRRHVRSAGAAGTERFRLESVAEREVYERLWEKVSRLDTRDRESAVRILGTKLDCVNLGRAARLRVYHALAPEEVLLYAIRGGRFLGSAERAVLAEVPPGRWSAALAHTPYRFVLGEAETPPALELSLERLLARETCRELSRNPFCIGIPLAYLILEETLTADLRRLCEGKHFGWSESRILEGVATERGR
jgi:vacuolar-type H+-ATPase subunit C/Vma6